MRCRASKLARIPSSVVNQNLPHAGRYPGRYPDLQAENVIGYPKGYREKIRYPGRYPDLQADNGRYPAHSLWRYIILYSRGCGGTTKDEALSATALYCFFHTKGAAACRRGMAPHRCDVISQTGQEKPMKGCQPRTPTCLTQTSEGLG